MGLSSLLILNEQVPRLCCDNDAIVQEQKYNCEVKKN